MSGRSYRKVAVTLLILVAVLFQVTWALAGTTGGISGTVTDEKGAPVAGAAIKAVSASQTASATTDRGGHFTFLGLSPDTYTLSAEKDGYAPISHAGITVFADQQLTEAFTLQPALKTIARVTSTAAGSLVKGGVTNDVYSVNAAQAAAAAPLGGGGNLNNAYSAMASVPGVQTSVGGLGWDYNAAYVRGQNSYYTGYEYDGIPVNRAFDNYNSSTESSLGLQELQVYTGGGPSSVTSSGTAGFINQVIKTGTFPGFATATLGLGTPTFYHQAQVEAGGSTPDRNFSYYVGVSGYNQGYRDIDNWNGAGFMGPGGVYSGPNSIGQSIGYTLSPTPTGQGIKGICPLAGQTGTVPAQGCWEQYSGIFGFPQQISDREAVVNLHFGIPHKNGLRDDVQAMWSSSSLNNYWYSSPNDAGPGNAQFINALDGVPYAPPVCTPTMIAPGLTTNACAPQPHTAYLPYSDGVAYNLPFGTTISSTPGVVTRPSIYYAPDTPQHAFLGGIPLGDQDINVNQNNAGIEKIQYTRSLGESAYVRLYGYSFYSDWLETVPFNGSTDQRLIAGNGAAQYQLITHTRGLSLQFEDQLNPQNLVSLSGNYVTAGVIRLNNSSGILGVENEPIGYMSGSGSHFTCYDPTSGAAQPCLTSSYYNVATGTTASPTFISSTSAGPTGYGAGGAATWQTLWSGNITGSYNTVKPVFEDASFSDEIRPNDRFLFDASIRYDNYTYDLPDSTSSATQFYAAQTSNYTCVRAATNQVLLEPLAPGAFPPAPAVYVNGDCNAAVAALFPASPATGWVHPNGTMQDGVLAPNFTAASPSSYTINYWEPRFSMTYTQSPDTVWRLSAGRFTQPPISASVQYLSASGDDRSVWNNTMNLGFYTPFHPIPGISSGQYDLSFEHHFRGTDLSLKLSPFFTYVTNWQQQTFIGAGFVTQVPVGANKIWGTELALSKGDFNRNGLSASLSVTYTGSLVQFQSVGLSGGGVVPNQTTSLNQAIQQYNQLAKGGSANFPCFTPATPGVAATGTPPVPGTGVTTCGPTDIANPYFNSPQQPMLDPNGWYHPYTTAIAPNLSGADTSYISPLTAGLILNYRHNKLAITPSFQFLEGTWYGSPLDINGVDPRACAANQATSGAVAAGTSTALNCNYTTQVAPGFGQFAYLYIPDPQTGKFAYLNYQEPSILAGNLQISYDVSPRVRLTVTGANLFHTCFGGSSEPWTVANPPSTTVCGYGAAGGTLNTGVYPANFFNGTGFNDKAANSGVTTPTVWQQSYTPQLTNSSSIGTNAVLPLNIYFTAQIKI
jgi:hypothetical protein